MNAYVKSYDGGTKWVYFLKIMNYSCIWNQSAIVLRKELDCKPIYNKTFLKAKIKSYATNLHNKEIPKVGFNYTCLAVVLIDFAL